MWASRVLLLVPQLILVPYLIATIGESGYGVYAMVWPLMTSIEQIQMSLQQGVVKYSAAFLAKGRMDEVNGVVSSSLVYSALIGLLAFAGMSAAAATYWPSSPGMGAALAIVAAMLLLVAPLTPFVAIIQSRQRYWVDEVAGTFAKYLSLAAVFAWFSAVGPSVQAVIGIMAGMLFISRLVQAPIAFWTVPGLRIRPGLYTGRHLSLIISFSGMVLLIGLFLMINQAGVRWLMGALASTDFVAKLAIMLMPGLLLSQVVGAMTVTAMPATSAFQATDNVEMLRELMIRGMRYTAVLVMAGLIAAWTLMGEALAAWVGPEYASLAPWALALFAGASFLEITTIAHHMLKGLGKLRTVVAVYLVGMVAVPLAVILALFALVRDPLPAAVAGIASGYVVCGLLNAVFCSRAVRAGAFEILWRVYIQSGAIAAAAGTAAFCAVRFGGLDSPAARVAVAFAAVSLFAMLVFAFAATADEKKRLRELVSLISGKRA